MPDADFQRVLPTEGIDNFRDYGGYAAGEGARVRKRLLWRSAQHLDATPGDLEKVTALNLTAVIDLRGDSERAAFPCARPSDFAAEVLFAPGETAGLKAAAVHEEAAKVVSTVEQAREAMIRTYEGMAWRPVLVGTFRLFLRSLATRDGASLLHCYAGKDRTGVAADLVHHVLGVHPDDAMADYLLTNTVTDLDRRLARAEGRVTALSGHTNRDVVRTLMSVDPVYLDTARKAILARHGSMDRYLEEVLLVTAEDRAAIRSRLLE